MSLQNHPAQLCSVPHLTQLFLDRLGIEAQEGFYERAIYMADQAGQHDVRDQARAWLDFSRQTRDFEQALEMAAALV